MVTELKREWLTNNIALVKLRISSGEGAGRVRWFIECDGKTNLEYRLYAYAHRDAIAKIKQLTREI